jgi:hypothetical protein
MLLFLVKKRDYWLLTIVLIMYSLGVMVATIGLLIVNANAISVTYTCNSDYSYSWKLATTKNLKVANECVLSYNYGQIALGGAINVLCISFIIAMKCLNRIKIESPVQASGFGLTTFEGHGLYTQ